MALYADYERGRYPVWQSLDHPDFLPGSGIIFVTVTVSGSLSQACDAHNDSLKMLVGRVLQAYRVFPRCAGGR